MADLDRLEAAYSNTHHDLERAQILVNLRNMEMGRRNALYARAKGDGLLASRSIQFVKAGHN